jgi:uncharacterized protein
MRRAAHPAVPHSSAEEHPPNRAHRVSFTIAITWIGRLLDFRDRVLGWADAGRIPAGIYERVARQAISSGASALDAVFVRPASARATAAVLLCHGIGETVEQWFGVQQLLAAHGVASLVFDYSGYGRSTGRPDWVRFEHDAIAAFAALEQLAPQLPHAVLGFSLGSGVAAATINRLRAHRLILCEAFTSFRDAATARWIPKRFAQLVPPIWHARRPLSKCSLPVLIVHGEKDTVFPVTMATELAGYCSPRAEIVLVADTTHNQPFRRPRLDYWGPIIKWVNSPTP